MNPAMILSWIFGILLIHSQGFRKFWIFMDENKTRLGNNFNSISFYLLIFLKDFQIDNNSKTSKFFRIINEVPTVLLIIIIFVVVFKPL